MIQVKRTFNNGLFECEEIYSDSGMKILEKSNWQLWDTDIDNPITIAQKRHGDYVETSVPIGPLTPEERNKIIKMYKEVETSEPIEPFEEISEPIEEEEV